MGKWMYQKTLPTLRGTVQGHALEKTGALLSPHYDQKNNVSAVFTNLHSLKKGDTIVVEDEEGVTTTFVVRDIMVYDKDRDATDVFFSRDGNAHLNLVTCTGVWDKSEKSYSERIIVFSDKK